MRRAGSFAIAIIAMIAGLPLRIEAMVGSSLSDALEVAKQC
jgi:hypothetical protein